MKKVLKKVIPIASLFSCSFASMAFADNQGCCPTKCPPPPCAPCEPNPCCPTTPAYGYDVPCNFAILYDAGPRVCDGVDLFLTADFIWWTAREDGLGFAVTGFSGSETQNVAIKGSVHLPDWKWKPGFKVGAGLNLWHDGWDVYAQYTWLYSKADKRSVSSPEIETNAMVPIWGSLPLQTPINPTSASGKWRYHLNVIDGELGRNYFVSQYLTLRPFVGFKGTWQDQDYKVSYTQVATSKTTEEIIKQDQDMWGFGIRSGVNLDWQFVRCFSLFSDWALTALMTKFDLKRNDYMIQTGTTTSSFEIVNLKNEFYSMKGVLEFDIGLRWDIWFGCNDAFHFRLQAAWEEQLWWSQNNFINFGYINVEECAHGDLMLHGLTIKARFDF